MKKTGAQDLQNLDTNASIPLFKLCFKTFLEMRTSFIYLIAVLHAMINYEDMLRVPYCEQVLRTRIDELLVCACRSHSLFQRSDYGSGNLMVPSSSFS